MTDWASEYFEQGYTQRWALTPPSERTHLGVAGLWDRRRLSPNRRFSMLGAAMGDMHWRIVELRLWAWTLHPHCWTALGASLLSEAHALTFTSVPASA